jgi:putative DNA primase/helicase
MMDLRAIARTLGGEVSGRQVLAPGSGHSARDRSLSVRLEPNAPDGFLVHSHCGDDWKECRDYVRQRLGLPAWEPGDDRHEQRTISPCHLDKWDFGAVERECEDRRRIEDDLIRIKRAVQIWDEGRSPFKTAAEDYLRSRALVLPDELAGRVLWFHPQCPWRNDDTGKTEFIACLIAAFRSVDDDTITAIHRIRVDQPNRWPKTQRRMLGVVHRAAVKLGPIGDKMTIGEGIETCMAAKQLGLEPAWALGSVGAISFFPVLDGVQELRILGEVGEASNRAIKMCGRRWKRAGRNVRIARSNVGSDINDALMARASS